MRTLPFALAWFACTPPGGDDRVLTADPPDVVEDLDPDPNTFEAAITARPANVDIGTEVVRMLTYGASVPGPEIRVRQGDRVVVHLDNQLPDDFPTTIHWHGIEGNNAADGTPTTQHPVEPGQTHTYAFTVPRPGIYWFHPHIRGAQGTHSGLYGTLIVEDPDEPTLIERGVLPALRHTLVLSDLGVYDQDVIDVESDDGMVIMNGTEGAQLLVNGRVRPTFEVPEGEGVRLQMLNTSISRYWVVSVPGHTLYRVGGEGGLLERVRVEGGQAAGVVRDATGALLRDEAVDLGFARGEVLLGPAERADVVLVPQGSAGDTIPIRWEDFARGRHGMEMQGDTMVMVDAPDDGSRTGVEVASIRVTAGSGNYGIAEGDPVLAAVGRAIPPVIPGPDALDFTGPFATELQESMEMVRDGDRWEHLASFAIDGASWMPDHYLGPAQPEAPTARHARVGDRIVWEVRNTTAMAHPFHLHGFSYQPIGYVRADEDGTITSWDLETVEYEDTTHIPPRTSLLLHVELADPNGDGGAVGRWMKHCHLFQHGEAGMMSELIVSP